MANGKSINNSLVLVIGSSNVNCIVISRIVERMGLKAASERPEKAGAAIADMRPGMVVVDGDPADHACNAALADIARFRRRSENAHPRVIVLSGSLSEGQAMALGVADTILAKPITVDRLQPAIDALRRHGRF